MGTLVCFHAHPDDEAIATGGVMAKAAAAGHRVVLVTATRGEHGEVPDGYLRSGEELWERRLAEVAEAARILGVAHHEFLGYVDSGMMGTPENDAGDSFWQADVEEAASRLASVLDAEHADVLTVYDERGGYGHPDHIQVHRVGVRAAALAGTRRVFEATIDRDYVRELLTIGAASSPEPGLAQEMLEGGLTEMGSSSDEINTVVDVRQWVALKRKAMLAHGSQITEESWFARLPEEAFVAGFGQEWFIRRDAPPGWRGADLFEDSP
jgi:LmbE family N-acetylglucosaminyl deacetylase